jgi:hypothetical protein
MVDQRCALIQLSIEPESIAENNPGWMSYPFFR